MPGAHGLAEAHAEVAAEGGDVSRIVLREQERARPFGHRCIGELERGDALRRARCAADHMNATGDERTEQGVERLDAARDRAVEEWVVGRQTAASSAAYGGTPIESYRSLGE